MNPILDFELGCPKCGNLNTVLHRDEDERDIDTCYYVCYNCGNKFK